MRVAALSVCLAVALALVGARVSEGAPNAGSHYLVRPDQRLCPSPMCGGAWVRRVNHPTTRCADGSRLKECYVASVSDTAKPLLSVRAGSYLARGRLVRADIGGFPGLGALVVAVAWRPAGTLDPRGTTFRVADNGVRCVTTPCFSLTAVALEGGASQRLSGLDVSRVGATATDRARGERALHAAGLLVTGIVRTVANAGPAGNGRTLIARQLWLPVPAS